MPILKAYVFPHPPLAVPAVGGGEERKIATTLASFDRAAREIADLAPDTIIFITPHGTMYQDYFHISPGIGAVGDFSRFNAPQIDFEVDYDTVLADRIVMDCELDEIPAGFLEDADTSLDHGVMVPMWFINQHYRDYRIIRISQAGLSPVDHYRFGQAIAHAIGKLDRSVVLVASGDLSHKLPGSHYGSDPAGEKFDATITDILESGDFCSLLQVSDDLRRDAAECGFNSIMLLAGVFDGLIVDSSLYSYEGPFGVGYAIAAITPGAPDEERKCLNLSVTPVGKGTGEDIRIEDAYQSLARRSLEYTVTYGKTLPIPERIDAELLVNKAGVFVSLHKKGELRGCIGTIGPTTDNVASEIIQNAVSAGLSDTRFSPVTAAELGDLTYKVDVLSEPELIDGPEDLDVKRYGVIVSNRWRRGLLLPNLEGVDTVEEQIEIARQKAGIPDDAPVALERFEVIRHE
ncbi:MAG: AmmeMemoRadiSam system protein A [Coriobacteriia bacterium]|nr:AmmeMemoRadiSam system protein A [Coriobacteriia bacterium]